MSAAQATLPPPSIRAAGCSNCVSCREFGAFLADAPVASPPSRPRRWPSRLVLPGLLADDAAPMPCAASLNSRRLSGGMAGTRDATSPARQLERDMAGPNDELFSVTAGAGSASSAGAWAASMPPARQESCPTGCAA